MEQVAALDDRFCRLELYRSRVSILVRLGWCRVLIHVLLPQRSYCNVLCEATIFSQVDAY